MCLHHELSYARPTPSRLVFTCLSAPTTGGATPLADAAAVLRDLPTPLASRFADEGWQLRRSHNDLVGVDWPQAFGTNVADEVERYCAEHAIEWEWDASGALRTRRRRDAVVTHPVSGEPLWFNQIAFLNEWTMDPDVREYLLLELGPDGLPYNTFYGGGDPLNKSTVDLINEVYAAHTVREPWQAGDVLVVDNLRTAHGRDPYQGDREIVVALADPVGL
jgi:alpha-ketoglutarate-dependent taurine dioxygenase